MDPISQGSLGATFAQGASRAETVKKAAILGGLAGMAPDLDILIFSPTDPLLFLEFHRQFTHALVFIPFGALIVAAVLHRTLGRGLKFYQTYLFCLLGYATHGLLDACTTYGTQLLWPFSDMRVAWNTVSIIDPFFTLPILALVIFSVLRRAPGLARIACVWALVYMGFGIVQRERAEAVGLELAQSRGHAPIRLEAKPGFANLLVWKIVYEADGRFYVDAARVIVDTKVYPGDSVAKLDVASHLPWLDESTQQGKDVERFRWFSNDYLAIDPEIENRVIDIRYSVVPNEIDAMWAIDLNPDKGSDEHVHWTALRRADTSQTSRWWDMFFD